MKKKVGIKQLGNLWYACYVDEEGIYRYIEHAKTKNDLIIKLAKELLICKGWDDV